MRWAVAVAVLGLGIALRASGLELLVNPGFEIPDFVNPLKPLGWESTEGWVPNIGGPGDDSSPSVHPAGLLSFGNSLDVVVSQEVPLSFPPGLVESAASFKLEYRVARNQRPGEYWVLAEFLNGPSVVATLRRPESGTEAAPETWTTYALELGRDTVPNFDQITAVKVSLFGKQSEHEWGGHYGPFFDFVSLSVTPQASPDIALSESSLAENNAANATVGILSVIDTNAGAPHTFTLVSGTGDTDNAAFNVNGSALRLTGSADFEAKSSYSVRVRATDTGDLFFEKDFVITVSDVNDAPTDLALSASSLAENNAANATVGTLTATDVDAGSTHTFTLVSGTGDTDNAAFNVNGSALRLTGSADFEAKSSYSVRVRATDTGGLFFEKDFVITVSDVNEALTDLALSAATMAENNAANATVGTLTATDVDAGSTHTFTLVSGTGDTDNAAFNVNGSALRLTGSADFEAKSSYSVRVRATDTGGLFFEKDFVITVSDVNEAPTISTISGQTTAEDTATSAIAFTVGDVETAVGSLTVTATSSDLGVVAAGGIALGGSGANRTITLSPVANASGTSTITVTVTDAGGLTATRSFVLTVTAVNDAPTISAISDQTTLEDTGTGAIAFTVGDVETAAGSLTVTATSSNVGVLAAGGIALGGSGAERMITLSPVANASGTSTITVTVTDAGGLTATRSFALTVTAAVELLVNPQFALLDPVNPLKPLAWDSTEGWVVFSGSGGNDAPPAVVANGLTDRFLAFGESSSVVVSQTVPVFPMTSSGVDSFSLAYEVVKNQQEGIYWVQAEFLDASGTVLATLRRPSSGTEAAPSALTANQLVLNRDSLANFDQITQVRVSLFGQQSPYAWSGHYGPFFNYVSLTAVLLPNTAPTITAISGQTTAEDTATSAIAFTVGDVETAAGSLTVTATSSNLGVVATNGIALGGSGASRTITLNPVANASGTSTIMVTVTDAGGASATNSFVLIVTPVPDVPTLEGFLLGAGLMPVVGGDGRYRLEASLGQAIAGSLPKVGSLDLASGFWFLDRLANALPGQLGDIPTPAQAAKGLMLQRATVAASRTDRLSSGTAPQMASGVRLLEARIRVAAVGDTAKVRILVSGLPKARLRVQSREGFGTGSWRDDGILQLDGEGEGFLETSGGDVSAMRFYRLVQP
jgi:uncharacterized lipoprotein YbaY